MKKALGSIEVCGYGAALLVMNRLYQYADVHIVNLNFNKPAVADIDRIPLQVQIEFTGDVDQVQYGLDVAYEEAIKYNDEDEIICHLIPRTYLSIKELKI